MEKYFGILSCRLGTIDLDGNLDTIFVQHIDISILHSFMKSLLDYDYNRIQEVLKNGDILNIDRYLKFEHFEDSDKDDVRSESLNSLITSLPHENLDFLFVMAYNKMSETKNDVIWLCYKRSQLEEINPIPYKIEMIV